jgi:succinate dehydrogenase/fumarate reductase-like Fe-S protein
MDLSFGEIVRAAAQNDPIALDNATLWNCDPVIEQNPVCPSGLDRTSVIQALREEALVRGYRRSK